MHSQRGPRRNRQGRNRPPSYSLSSQTAGCRVNLRDIPDIRQLAARSDRGAPPPSAHSSPAVRCVCRARSGRPESPACVSQPRAGSMGTEVCIRTDHPPAPLRPIVTPVWISPPRHVGSRRDMWTAPGRSSAASQRRDRNGLNGSSTTATEFAVVPILHGRQHAFETNSNAVSGRLVSRACRGLQRTAHQAE